SLLQYSIRFSKNQSLINSTNLLKTDEINTKTPAKTFKYSTKQQLIAYLCGAKTRTGSSSTQHKMR
ncbi:MAG: hypothetical protein IKV78_07655, partial [Methanocorpusculum sp.]|nr:hypothetical protein [Methanocorpusculum sp.]